MEYVQEIVDIAEREKKFSKMREKNKTKKKKNMLSGNLMKN